MPLTSADTAVAAIRRLVDRFGRDAVSEQRVRFGEAVFTELPTDPVAAGLLNAGVQSGVAEWVLEHLEGRGVDEVRAAVERRLAGFGMSATDAEWGAEVWTRALAVEPAASPPGPEPEPPAAASPWTAPDAGAGWASPGDAGVRRPAPTAPTPTAPPTVPTPAAASADSGPQAPPAGAPRPGRPPVDWSASTLQGPTAPSNAAPPSQRTDSQPRQTGFQPRAAAVPAAAVVLPSATGPAPVVDEGSRPADAFTPRPGGPGATAASASGAVAVPPPPKPRRTRPPRDGRRRRTWIWITVAVVVVVALIGGGIAAVRAALDGVSADAAASSAVRALPSGGATGTVVDGARTSGLKPAGTTLHAGQVINATNGPLEIRVGPVGFVRLDRGASVTYLRAPNGKTEAQFQLESGQVYVAVRPGGRLGLQTPIGHGELTRGRLDAVCSASACTFQALEEPQEVHLRQGSMMVPLKPHQSLYVPLDGGSSPSPSTSVATAASDTPKPYYSAPDLLRKDPWITTNTALDRRAGLRFAAITGRSILGTWQFDYDSSYVGTTLHRQVVFSVDCTDGIACAMQAHSQYSTCPSAIACDYTGSVVVSDQQGDHGSIDYSGYPVDCDGDRKTDGTGDAFETVSFAGAGDAASVNGTREATYKPAKGSACAKKSKNLTAPTIPFTGTARVRDALAFPVLSASGEEELIARHTDPASGVNCERVTPLPAHVMADIECTFDGAKDSEGDQRPAKVELQLYLEHDRLTAAYQAIAKRAGVKTSGNCDEGTCEEPLEGTKDGRLASFGSAGHAELIGYNWARSHVLVHATGGASTTADYTWWLKTGDFAIGFYPNFGV